MMKKRKRVIAKRRMALFIFLLDGGIFEHFSQLRRGIHWTDLQDRKRK